MNNQPERFKSAFTTAMLMLLIVWGLIIWFINPVGEFMINDDWSFVRALEIASVEGRVPATGWGAGGPSLFTHLMWGWIFTKLFGFSVTVLRISVLVMAILGSICLLELLKRSGASPLLALWGTLAIVLNPLFLSQSFTFMTDITLATLMIFSLLFVSQGLEQQRRSMVALGLLFVLAALLTRQIAIAIPVGIIITLLINPKARLSGLWPIILMTLAIAIVPWICFEVALKKMGSTSLTDHEVVHAIINDPLQFGLGGYLFLLFGRLVIGIGYVSVLVSPVTALWFRELFTRKLFRLYFIVGTAIFLAIEVAISLNVFHPPVAFYRNVIFNFGIGPLLLKDTYILHLARSWTIPDYLYYCLAYWAFLNAGALFSPVFSYIANLFRQRHRGASASGLSVISTLSMATVATYSGIILLTGYHDRYLVPVCILLIIWFISVLSDPLSTSFKVTLSSIPAFVAIAGIGFFSIAGTRDFLATKTALKQAQEYLIGTRQIPPCDIDGGFEFNGFNCYKKGFVQKPGLSWWWVEKEDYLLTLGPLPGYTVDSIFPFKRILFQDGAVYVLMNEHSQARLHADPKNLPR